MYLEKIVRLLNKYSSHLVVSLNAIAFFSVLVMAFLITIDVILRGILNRPVPGASEISELIMVLLVSFGLSYCAKKDGHIKIDFVLVLLSERIQAIIRSIGGLLTLGLFVLITWQTALYSYTTFKYKTASIMLDIPIFPFVAIVAFGCGMFCLTLLIDFLDNLCKVVKK